MIVSANYDSDRNNNHGDSDRNENNNDSDRVIYIHRDTGCDSVYDNASDGNSGNEWWWYTTELIYKYTTV